MKQNTKIQRKFLLSFCFMERGQEQQGFELLPETFEIVQPKFGRDFRISEEEASQSRSSQLTPSKKRQPPYSTYVSIPNYQTSSILNSFYSTDNISIEYLGDKEQIWSASYEATEEEIFNQGNKKYKLIYDKFGSKGRVNYNFFGEYSRQQYKTFSDVQDSHKQTSASQFANLIHSKSKKQQHLQFCSNFQSGNLDKAYALNTIPISHNYYLLLSKDTNTLGYNQWFYFSVSNENKRTIYSRYTIVNMGKKIYDCVKKLGICIFSEKQFENKRKGWYRICTGIQFNTQNNLKKENGDFYFSFSFEVIVKSQDKIYLALTLPYTFTKLTKYALFGKFKIIGESFSGNPIYVYRTGNEEAKKSIIIMGRQHPSETSGSFAIEGVINELQKQSPLISFLKKKYLIVVFPMVNPDGVIHGNSRTNLVGLDINRKWEGLPDKKFSYEIYHIFHYILSKVPSIEYLLDFHGHSKKLNSFGYFSFKNSKLVSIIASEMGERLPWFKIEDCQMNESLQIKTLRWFSKEVLRVNKVITIQISLHGWSDEQDKVHAFQPKEIQKIGESMIDVLCLIQLKKKSSNLKATKNLELNKHYLSSDSDPEGEYTKQTLQALQKSGKSTVFKKKYRIHSLQKMKRNNNNKSPNRARVTTQFFEKPGVQVITPKKVQLHKKSTQSNRGLLKLKPTLATRTINKSLTFKNFYRRADLL